MHSCYVAHSSGSWRFLLVPGILAAIIGLVILLFPGESLRILVYLLGGIALLVGIALIAGAWSASRTGGRMFAVSLVMGLAALFIGIFAVIEPASVEASLAILFGALLLVAGLGAAFNVWSRSPSGSQGFLGAVGGIAVAVIGILIILSPGVSAKVLVQIIGAFFLVIGIAICLIALVVRSRQGRSVQNEFRVIERY